MLCSLSNVSLGFGDRPVLTDVSVNVNENDRIGFIGANGAGKTTLLSVLTRDMAPDDGLVIHSSGLRIGYLRQNSGLDTESDIMTELRGVFSRLTAAEARMREIEAELAGADHGSALCRALSAEYSKLQSFYETNDGYNTDIRIKTVLNGMGFSEKALDTPIRTLSGGEKTRLAIARLLLEAPTLLILDEPTNHLDFATLAWLEGYLASYKGALLIVSHDRYFLDRTVNRIWELEDCRVYTYRGNYSKYKQTRAEQLHHRKKEYEKQAIRMAAMREYAEKNIARASTSKSAKSRLAQLEHMEPLEKPREYKRTPTFEFDFPFQSVKDVLSVRELELSVGTPRHMLCPDVSFEVKRGQRVAVIGKNGAGKSTLLKLLMDVIRPRRGTIEWGRNVSLAYYEQESHGLDTSDSVLDELWRRFPHMEASSLRGALARMLITGDEVFKSVSVLSGGEKAKLGFAIMQLTQGNTLVLDEPTNHLDLPSREALEDALRRFEGTLIFVSHDRYFLSALADRMIELEDGEVRVHECGFEEYSAARRQAAAEKRETVRAEKAQRQTGYRDKKQRAEETKRRMRIGELERAIAANEERQSLLNDAISGGELASDYKALTEACDELEALKADLDTLMEEWLELSCD